MCYACCLSADVCCCVSFVVRCDLFGLVRCLLHAGYCPLGVWRCVLCVAGSVCVVCCMACDARCSLFADCCMLIECVV